MGKMLSEAEVGRYRERGYHFPVRAMGTEDAAGYRDRLEAAIAANPTGLPPARLLKSKAHLVSTALFELIHLDPILDAVEDVLGPDILCWASGVFRKLPGTPDFVSWHQDAMYWGLEPADIVTAWVALTDSTVANGAVRVIPGSHRQMLPHADTYATHNLLSRGQEIAVQVDEGEAVDLVLRAGEFSLHHVKLAHGSKANASATPRIGLAIRYVAPQVQAGGAGDSAILVRGSDRYGHFERDPAPTRDYDPAALQLLERAQSKTVVQPGAPA